MQKQQNRLPDMQTQANADTNRCKWMRRQAYVQPDRLPDVQPNNQIARWIVRQPAERAGRPAEQMDIQTDRCTARYADGHAAESANPIEKFTVLPVPMSTVQQSPECG
jgi:hypothetical protein